MGIIVPAILEKNFDKAEERINYVRELVSWIQCDVTDGVMVEGRSFELELLTKLSQENDDTLWDIHLMVRDPINWINKAIFANASRIIGQVEMMKDRENFVKSVKDNGVEAGLAFDIETKIEAIPQETDVVLLMGRKAGFGSIPMDDRIFGRIEELKKIRDEGKHSFLMAVDGGINKDNIGKLVLAGVEIFYCTGAIYNGDIKSNLEILRNNVNL